MSMWNITVNFIYLLLIIITGMMLISSFKKTLITLRLRRLCSKTNGSISQRGIRSFPRFDGEYEKRKIAIFFHIAKTKKAYPIYLLYTITADLPFKLFLLRKDEFKYLEGFNLATAVGKPLEGLKDGFKAWSDNDSSAMELLSDTGLKEDMDSLIEFPSILFGPDHIVIGKQYEGKKDLSTDKLLAKLAIIGRMAVRTEALCKK